MALPACFTARGELSKASEQPKSTFLPSNTRYFPISKIKQIFATNNCLRDVFLCECAACTRDSGLTLEHREALFNPNDFGSYVTVYALLIWHHRAGLIHLFQQHEVYLSNTTFFNEGSLEFLRGAGVAGQEIISDILRDQYSFQIRTLEPCRQPTTISSYETLPIIEDEERKGRGDFGQVYGFRIPFDEYRGEEFRRNNVERFARKIFNTDDNTSGLKEWFTLLHLKRINHGHLMPALGAFSHGKHFFILFEEASETLGTYLKSDGTSFRPQELWKQVQGLAEGLAHLHGKDNDRIAYHRDLKPANILIVRGTMKISDFGLLQFKSPGPIGDSNPSIADDIFDSRAYVAPQSKDGRYTRPMDVWSLGAIISEIATFDLEKKEGVQQYRSERKQDMEEGQNYALMRFHNKGKMKISVRERHKKLHDKVKRSMRPQNREEIDHFQQKFLTESFFGLVEEMLWDGDGGCPSAEAVATRLQELYYHALTPRGPDRPSTSPEGDIWEDIEGRRLIDSPLNANCRLRGHLVREMFNPHLRKCGLLLHGLAQNQSLLVRCFIRESADMQLHEIRETFMRMGQKYPSIIPDYVSNTDERKGFNVTLYQPDRRYYTYKFANLRDMLNLQAAMTNQYAYEFKSYSLDSFALFKKNNFLRPTPTPVMKIDNATTQLWSEGDFDEEDQKLWDDTSWALAPRMHVAILSMMTQKLVLIKVTSEPKVRLGVAGQHTVVLEDVGVHEISIETGIPMKIPEPPNGYKKYTEARLCFRGLRAEEDSQKFYEQIDKLQKKWQGRVIRTGTGGQ
ncbi:hypothetical protein AWENTII_001831 [Aspergillus wentii]